MSNVSANSNVGKTYDNPVLPGFYPDPSIVRVGEDYYMVTSTFEYYPGVPVFHSKNLAQWTQIGHCLTRKSQADFRTRKSSQAIFAPTIRYHDGVFYMITTDVWGIGNFYVTATDPAGPWSDPIIIEHGGIDPSLFFDDDGKVYVTVQRGADYDSHAIQYEIDIETGKALTEPVVVWKGDGGPWIEAPHLYKINGTYYMMSASGGTADEHREIIGKSDNPYGPFEMLPHPILTHRNLKSHPIQFLGHGDLVDDVNGNWWMVFLGVRHMDGDRKTVLGRETFLAPVVWTEDGWPMVDNDEGTVNLVMPADALPAPLADVNEFHEAFVDDFDQSELDHRWCGIRYIGPETYSLTERPGSLTLYGREADLNTVDITTFIGTRQRHFETTVTTAMTFDPQQDGEEAGLSIRLRESAHYELGVKRIDGQNYIVVNATTNEQTREVNKIAIDEQSVQLRIVATKQNYELLYSIDGNAWQKVSIEPTEPLSPDTAGGFTGVLIGMYATGNGKLSTSPAYFDWFRYTPN